jgi:hypothetical protein
VRKGLLFWKKEAKNFYKLAGVAQFRLRLLPWAKTNWLLG